MIGDLEELTKIRELLAEHPRGMSITDLSRKLGLHRTTVARYMDGLQMKGEADLRIVSTAKVYHLAARIPSSAISTFTCEPYLLITCRLVIGSAGNGISGLLGLSDDLTGRQISDSDLAGFIQEEMMPGIKLAIQGEKSSVNLTIRQKEEMKELTISIIPAVCEDGRPGCVLICKDETLFQQAVKQAEICTREAEALASDQNEFVIRIRPDGLLTYANDAFCRRMERTRDEIVGFPYEPVISHENLNQLKTLRSMLTREDPTGIITFKVIQPDGMVSWEEWHYRGIFTQDGTIREYQAIGSDISERKHLEEQLHTYHSNFEAIVTQRTREMKAANQDLMAEIARREKLERELLIIRFVFDQASDSILLFERTGALYRANETACKLLGYTREEIQQITVFGINPEITQKTWDQMWEYNSVTEDSSRVRSVHRRRNGELIPVEISRKFISAGPLSLFCSIARQIIMTDEPEHGIST
ncbi:MAG: PAS domain S-box protein [Methanospirillum sp.]|uniref:PAS domain S-box protein n=1 Tax=Methanospirillum sp. TaxID=45200 RepID=UPI0023699B37|nr:PAS domain S-box protein [Methanospirillum sp.]MDD1728616.1 PAS domain S-box protein [Methanospirillum sp.]